MGQLDDWDKRTDILFGLARHGMLHLLELIFKNLSSADLRMVCRVNSLWFGLVKQLIHHGELSYLSQRWKTGEPKVHKMQCTRTRSVCTVTSLAADDTSIAAGLGSSGKIEIWNRRTSTKELEIEGHKEGIYTLQLGRYTVISGGEDGVVRVWSRKTGEELAQMLHHSYIVWSVRLYCGSLVTASYDCTVCYLDFQETESDIQFSLKNKIQGPWEWADALYIDERGKFLVVHCDETFELKVWNIVSQKIISRLSGHSDEVHAVAVRGNLLVSGASDKRILVWDMLGGICLAELLGHEGKVWSIGIHRTRIASGGRFGEVRVWDFPNLEQLTDNELDEPDKHLQGESVRDCDPEVQPQEAFVQDCYPYEQPYEPFVRDCDPDEQHLGASVQVSDPESIASATDPEDQSETSTTRDLENNPEKHPKHPKHPKLLLKGSRPLLYHPKSSSVSALHIDSFCLVTGDGLATLVEWDFWNPGASNQPCKKYMTPVPDPLLV